MKRQRSSAATICPLDRLPAPSVCQISACLGPADHFAIAATSKALKALVTHHAAWPARVCIELHPREHTADLEPLAYLRPQALVLRVCGRKKGWFDLGFTRGMSSLTDLQLINAHAITDSWETALKGKPLRRLPFLGEFRNPFMSSASKLEMVRQLQLAMVHVMEMRMRMVLSLWSLIFSLLAASQSTC